MAYHIYNTEGFILESRNIREANKLFTIFTKDLGLIRASAQSVRSVHSKLRFHLQDFSNVKLSLVRGKEFWKITSVSGADDFYFIYKDNKTYLHFYIRILNLLKRLLHGEEKNDSLFDLLNNAFNFLKNNNIEDGQLDNLECILVLKVLHNLGYVGDTERFKHFIAQTEWNESFLLAMAGIQKEAIRAINHSLKESHL